MSSGQSSDTQGPLLPHSFSFIAHSWPSKMLKVALTWWCNCSCLCYCTVSARSHRYYLHSQYVPGSPSWIMSSKWGLRHHHLSQNPMEWEAYGREPPIKGNRLTHSADSLKLQVNILFYINTKYSDIMVNIRKDYSQFWDTIIQFSGQRCQAWPPHPGGVGYRANSGAHSSDLKHM